MTFNDLNNIDGLQFIPLTDKKAPIPSSWQKIRTKYDFSNAWGIGLACGFLSNNVEGLDFDLKYDLTGDLMDRYTVAVNQINPNIIRKLLVQETISGGYHFIYRCSEIEGNKKLANRHSTQEERNTTYQTVFSSRIRDYNASNDPNDPNFIKAAEEAYNAAESDKVRVLIETRGTGGQLACWPSPGYSLVQGDFANIPEITPEERDILWSVARTFNEYFKNKPDKLNDHQQKKNYKGLTPSEDFNERGDVVALLQRHGWTFVRKTGSKNLMRRPGLTTAETSGNYDEDKKWFSVFSTSTQFDSQKPYKPYAVYAILECNGDYSEVTKKLAQEGYGEPFEKIKENMSSTPSIIDTNDEDDLSFLATESEMDDYLKQFIDGTFKMGLETGSPELDKYFRFKHGNLVICNGVDNVGKSSILWYLCFLSSLLHGWKHVIFSSENKSGQIKKKIMEFYHCKKITQMSEAELKSSKEFFSTHFRLIKNADVLYNYQDIINMTDKTLRKFKANSLLLDPYNSLKVESKQTYEYHYEVASKLKLYGDKNNLSIYLNAHVNTAAARRKDEKGFVIAPDKADTEMGVMFANKADDFLTVHRLTNHETEFIFTELHVRKIKDMETGGRPTPISRPVFMRSVHGMVGFNFVSDKSMTTAGFNPVLNYWERKNGSNSIFDQAFEDLQNKTEEDAPF